jgi:nucleoside-diphosphate-sugar epimerase
VTTGPAWLVTGATGFLGRHLLTRLAHDPDPLPVVALLRDPGEWTRLPWTRDLTTVVPVPGDVTDPAIATRLEGLPERLAGIVHLAALVSNRRSDEPSVLRVNVEGTLHLVRLAASHRCRMIFVSTSGTVGCFRDPGRSAGEDAPYCEEEVRGWPYYRSKILAEQRARALAGELGVELVIVRPPILLGPDDHRHRSTNHVRRLLAGKVPVVIRGGMHFADVRDVAAALVRLMRRDPVRPVYHLPGVQCSIEAFYADVARIAGAKPPRAVVPYRAAWAAAKLTHGLGLQLFPEPALVEMAAHYWGMHSKYAEPELGYRTRPGEDTLRDTIAWLRRDTP